MRAAGERRWVAWSGVSGVWSGGELCRRELSVSRENAFMHTSEKAGRPRRLPATPSSW